MEVSKNTANNGREEHSAIEEKVPEKWDPNFIVSTWDHSILGLCSTVFCDRRIYKPTRSLY